MHVEIAPQVKMSNNKTEMTLYFKIKSFTLFFSIILIVKFLKQFLHRGFRDC